MLHQIGKIHGLIHDMTTTHEVGFVESFDVLWERVCKYIFSIIDYYFRLDYGCNKKNSYYSPPSTNDELEGASPHVLCLERIDA